MSANLKSNTETLEKAFQYHVDSLLSTLENMVYSSDYNEFKFVISQVPKDLRIAVHYPAGGCYFMYTAKSRLEVLLLSLLSHVDTGEDIDLTLLKRDIDNIVSDIIKCGKDENELAFILGRMCAKSVNYRHLAFSMIFNETLRIKVLNYLYDRGFDCDEWLKHVKQNENCDCVDHFDNVIKDHDEMIERQIESMYENLHSDW